MTQLTSIGTLFAFVLVSGGVLLLPRISNIGKTGFKLPYWNGRYIMPLLYVIFMYAFWSRLGADSANISHQSLQEILFLVFSVQVTALSVATVIGKFSLIPVLGVLFCAYLLVEDPYRLEIGSFAGWPSVWRSILCMATGRAN